MVPSIDFVGYEMRCGSFFGDGVGSRDETELGSTVPEVVGEGPVSPGWIGVSPLPTQKRNQGKHRACADGIKRSTRTGRSIRFLLGFHFSGVMDASWMPVTCGDDELITSGP